MTTEYKYINAKIHSFVRRGNAKKNATHTYKETKKIQCSRI